jgi:hypothetical protein
MQNRKAGYETVDFLLNQIAAPGGLSMTIISHLFSGQTPPTLDPRVICSCPYPEFTVDRSPDYPDFIQGEIAGECFCRYETNAGDTQSPVSKTRYRRSFKGDP